MKHYCNIINGKPVNSASGETFSNTNPADTGEVIGLFQNSCIADVKAACLSADIAFHKWKRTRWPERKKIIDRVRDLMTAKRRELATIITKEQGKIISDALAEVDRSIDVIDFYAGLCRMEEGLVMPSARANTLSFTRRVPVGVYSAVSPWNFPLVVPVWKIIPAVAFGNTVVFKPATSTPFSSYYFCEMLHEAGLPEGVVNYISGSGAAIGNELIDNPAVKGISFTGSTEVGLGIFKRTGAGGRLIRTQLELGGKNCMLVMEDADLDLALEDFIIAGLTNCGQRCTATSRIIIQKSIAARFCRMLVDKIKLFKIGNGLDPEVDLGPVANKRQYETILEFIKIGREEGAELVYGGNALARGHYAKGFFVEPAIFGNVTENMRIAKEEIFGPVISVIPVDDFKKGLAIANSVPYGLSASIYTNNLGIARRFMDEMEAGMVHVNSPTVFNETNMPFGGIKSSGFGPKENGKTNVEFFTETKSIYMKAAAGL